MIRQPARFVGVSRWGARPTATGLGVGIATLASPASMSSPVLFFQKTKIPLQKWFLAISLVLNAKKGLSSYQLARDLELNQKSAWYLVMRVRRAMVDDGTLLTGIVETDEAYIGGIRWTPLLRQHEG